MKIDQFILLTDIEKEEIVFSSGEFFTHYYNRNYMYDVFKLFDFYVTIRNDLKSDDDPTIIVHIAEKESNFCMN